MKRILMVIIIFLIMLIPKTVFALSDSFYEAEYINGEYIKKFIGNKGKYEQLRVFRSVKDNIPVYCLEIWETLNSNKELNGYTNLQYNYGNIPYDIWKKVVLLAYYGYNYKDSLYDHTNIKWYAITQFMIWNEISKDSIIFFTDTLNGNKIEKYTKEMNEINTLLAMHDIKPSFNNTSYIMNYDEDIILNDDNNVLNRYSIYHDNAIKSSINGNELKFSLKAPGKYTLRLVSDRQRFNNEATIYVDKNGQDVLLPGKYDIINCFLDLELNKRDIVIHKRDIDGKTIGDSNILGAKFKLRSLKGNVEREFTIDNEDYLLKDVPYGNYNIDEVTPGIGYNSPLYMLPITVNDFNKDFTFYNETIKNKVIINKYIKSDEKKEKEEYAKFDIYNSRNEKVKEIVINNGYGEIILPYGIYTFKQVEGNNNYKFVDDFVVDVKYYNRTQEYSLDNEIKKVKLNVEVFDSETSLNILNEKLKIVVNSKELETNNDGITEYIEVPYGEYEIKLKSEVYGYEKNNEIYKLVIDDNINSEYTYRIPINKIYSFVKLRKIVNYYYNDELISQNLDEDITKEIFASEDIYTKDGIMKYQKNSIVKEINNKNIDSMLLGNYYVKNDNEIIKLSLLDQDITEVTYKEDIYKYSKLIEVPNTMCNKSNLSVLPLLISFIGLIVGEIKYEKD